MIQTSASAVGAVGRRAARIVGIRAAPFCHPRNRRRPRTYPTVGIAYSPP